jgi:hypothetical protein
MKKSMIGVIDNMAEPYNDQKYFVFVVEATQRQRECVLSPHFKGDVPLKQRVEVYGREGMYFSVDRIVPRPMEKEKLKKDL